MKSSPLILVTPSTQARGVELSDLSISVSEAYSRAVIDAGGTPMVMSCTAREDYVASCVRHCQGVLLTGGEDIQPELHSPAVSPAVRATVKQVEPERDVFELLLIAEIFRQRRPLLAICRGHQMLNVAFGGNLYVDLATEAPGPVNHRQFDRKNEPVHDLDLAPDSELARLLGVLKAGVNSTHHQAVRRLAGLFMPVAKSADGLVEAMELAPEHARLLPWMVSVQFHPERLFKAFPPFQNLFRALVRASR